MKGLAALPWLVTRHAFLINLDDTKDEVIYEKMHKMQIK